MKVCEEHGIKWVETRGAFIYFDKCEFADDGAAMLGFSDQLLPSGVIQDGAKFRQAAKRAGVEI